MKKLLIAMAIIISFGSSAALAQKNYNEGDLSLNGTMFVETATGQLANGIARIYYSSGQLQHELSYKNGKRDGITKRFDETGKLKSYYTYKNGQRNGTAKVYGASGYSVVEYVNDTAVRGTLYSSDGSRSSPMTQDQLLILSKI